MMFKTDSWPELLAPNPSKSATSGISEMRGNALGLPPGHLLVQHNNVLLQLLEFRRRLSLQPRSCEILHPHNTRSLLTE